MSGHEHRSSISRAGQSAWREKDLIALSIEMDEGMIPVPKAQSKINVGDRLICYGKLENIKELVLSKVTPSTKQNQGKPKGGRND